MYLYIAEVLHFYWSPISSVFVSLPKKMSKSLYFQENPLFNLIFLNRLSKDWPYSVLSMFTFYSCHEPFHFTEFFALFSVTSGLLIVTYESLFSLYSTYYACSNRWCWLPHFAGSFLYLIFQCLYLTCWYFLWSLFSAFKRGD